MNLKRGLNTLFFIVFFCVLLSSCVRPKDVILFRESGGGTVHHTHPQPYLVQSGDILSIKVSSIDPKSIAIFNKEVSGSSGQLNVVSAYVNGYIVNDSGTVKLPIIGDVLVANKTIENIQEEIEVKMEEFYKYFSIDVKLMSFRVTILGEVARPGTKVVYNKDMNVSQLLGVAGGFKEFANRKKISIVRKNQDSIVTSVIDLSTVKSVESEFYYLQPNDVVYVPPMKVKPIKSNLTLVGVSFSLINAFLLIFLRAR